MIKTYENTNFPLMLFGDANACATPITHAHIFYYYQYLSNFVSSTLCLSELDTLVVYRDPITFNKHVISVNLLVQM